MKYIYLFRRFIIKLNFLGRGAAFNSSEGNTSAYFVENNELFLIDCGESVFERLIKYNIFENINSINLMITHTHSDHIGSIGTLVFYSYYVLHKPLNIVLPKNSQHYSSIKGILELFGCDNDMYSFIDEKEYDNKYNTFNNIRYTKTDHRDGLNCYSLIFNTNNGIVTIQAIQGK